MDRDIDIVNLMIHAYKKSTKPFKIKVSGNSMTPVIQDGEYIIVKKSDQLRVGDIILFQYEATKLLVHRIVKIRKTAIYTKGDYAVDIEIVDKDSIIGRVSDIVKNDCFYPLHKRGFHNHIIAILSFLVFLKWKKKNNYELAMSCFCARMIQYISK